MNIIKKIDSIFNEFNKEDYIKFFVSLKDSKNPIFLSLIGKHTFTLIKSYFENFFTYNNNNLYLKEKYNTPQSITEIFIFIARTLEKQGVTTIRNEKILLQSMDKKYNLGYVDRSLLHIFGFLAEGIHLNTYIEKSNSHGNMEKYLWIAKRAKNKLHDPNKLDNLVAGAISLGFSPQQTLIKEAAEEAGIPKELLKTSILKQTIAYKVNKYGGLRNDIVHIFELKLPKDFIPKAIDGEVEEFFLLDCNSVLNMLIDDFDAFKYNSGLTSLYFLYSHNCIKNQELNSFLQMLFTKLSFKIK